MDIPVYFLSNSRTGGLREAGLTTPTKDKFFEFLLGLGGKLKDGLLWIGDDGGRIGAPTGTPNDQVFIYLPSVAWSLANFCEGASEVVINPNGEFSFWPLVHTNFCIERRLLLRIPAANGQFAFFQYFLDRYPAYDRRWISCVGPAQVELEEELQRQARLGFAAARGSKAIAWQPQLFRFGPKTLASFVINTPHGKVLVFPKSDLHERGNNFRGPLMCGVFIDGASGDKLCEVGIVEFSDCAPFADRLLVIREATEALDSDSVPYVIDYSIKELTWVSQGHGTTRNFWNGRRPPHHDMNASPDPAIPNRIVPEGALAVFYSSSVPFSGPWAETYVGGMSEIAIRWTLRSRPYKHTRLFVVT